jgi:hypothetical protein
MRRSDTLDAALDELDGSGQVVLERAGGRTVVDVTEVGRIGVRVRGLSVGHAPVDLTAEAEALPGRLRAVPDRIEAIEVAPTLGGAILRTRVDDIRDREFFEVDVRPEQTGLRRYRMGEEGREPVDFSVTREQLGHLIDELDGSR